MGDLNKKQRIEGCLLGGAVGDAFGYAVEFFKLSHIREKFGPMGLVEPVIERGRLLVSDDTQMTLFTAEGILEALQLSDYDYQTVNERIKEAYLRWLRTQSRVLTKFPPDDAKGELMKAPEMWAARAPGNTCLSALHQGGWGRLAGGSSTGPPPGDRWGAVRRRAGRSSGSSPGRGAGTPLPPPAAAAQRCDPLGRGPSRARPPGLARGRRAGPAVPCRDGAEQRRERV